MKPGGRGKKGGLSEYAQRIEKSQPYVSQVRSAAEVLESVETHKSTYGFSALLDKAQHLTAIHKSPREAKAAEARSKKPTIT